MALQKAHEFKGIEIPNGYHVVSNVRYDKLGNTLRFNIASYFDADTRGSGSHKFLGEETFYFNPSGSYDVVGDNDISTVCYNYLKTLDAWSGSVDV